MKKHLHFLAWIAAIALAIIGIIAIGLRSTLFASDLGSTLFAWRLLGVGGGTLAIFALISAWRTSSRKVGAHVGGIYLFGIESILFLITLVAATTTLFGNFTTLGRIALLITGVQSLSLAVSVHVSGTPFFERVIIQLIGHMLLLIGSAIILGIMVYQFPWRLIQGALLFYAVGFSLLALNTFWLGQHADTVVPPRPDSVHRYWEYFLIHALVIGIISVIVVGISLQTKIFVELLPNITQTQLLSIIAGIAAVIGIATLSAPDWSPRPLKIVTGIGSTIVQHSLITFLLLNTLVIALLFIVPEAFIWIIGAFIALLFIGVVFEYSMVFHAHRSLSKYKAPPKTAKMPKAKLVTAVVPMFNEKEIVSETIEHNIKTLDGISFILVPAINSTDGTTDLAYKYEEKYPDRISVVEGTAGSKAGDLNIVWDKIETPYVLLLDVDETIHYDFITRGIEVLKKSPSVGIVQGRKIEKYPYEKSLARFISSERRHSTWVDHPFWHDVFGASHFAGSAAILRHEVPKKIDGWLEDVLTEDIDLTMRLYLNTDWQVKYIPYMVAQTLTPRNFWELVRQRRRWARGWVDAMFKYGLSILRSGSKLGRRRSFGLIWELFTSVSAPLYTVFPSLLLVWFLGYGTSIPIWLSIILAILIIPAKAISIGYATLRDPEIPLPKNPFRLIEMIFHAYLWILMTWVVQPHALYLQLADAPKKWEPTRKLGKQN